MDFYLQYGNYLSNILQSLIKNKKPAQPDFKIDWSKFFHFCMHHKVANMVYLSIKDFDVPKEVLSKFKDVYSKLTFIEAKQEIYSTMVYSAFEDNEVSFLPVKGILIKKLYPVENYRSSGDIDILIKNSDFEKSCKVLESLGYKTFEKPNKGNDYHISYEKNSVHIELHSSLAPKDSNFYDYFNKSFHRAYLKENSKFHYLLNNEDFYIYHIVHMAKHFKNGGIGLIHILDLFVIRQNMKDLNMEYIDNQLDFLGLKKYKNTMEMISDNWFGDGSLCTLSDEQITLLTSYILSGGAFGIKKNQEATLIVNRGGNKFSLLRKIFPNKTTMVNYYGRFLGKHIYLLPLYWIRLNFQRLIHFDDDTKKAMEQINSIDQNYLNKVEKVLDICGLKD